MKRVHDLPTVAAQAAAWMARRDAGLSASEQAAFDRWCAADPRHAAAVAELQGAWTALDRPRVTGNVDFVRGELRSRARRRQRRLFGAVTALAAASIAVSFWIQRPARPSPTVPVATTARLLNPTRVVLSDDSIVEVSAEGQIEPAFTADLRRVRLVRGDAHFEVVKNPSRPFVVEAGPVQVRAVGTAFAVRLALRDIEVLVTEGRVAVERTTPANAMAPISAARAGPSFVTAGNRLVVPVAETPAPVPVAMPITSLELDRQLAWRWPRLEFTDTAIGEAAALFNRTNRVQLRTGDVAVADLRVTGVFRADNVEGFVSLLASTFGVTAERRGEGEIVLRSAK